MTASDPRVGEDLPIAYRPENRKAATDDLIQMLTASSDIPGNVNLPREAMNMLLAELRDRDDAHEREMTVLIKERDDMERMCDELAKRIAPPHVLGEHSSDNDPWVNALNYGDSTDWDNVSNDEVEALEEAALAQADAWDKGHEQGFWNGRLSQKIRSHDDPTPITGAEHAKAHNPYRAAAAVAAANGGGE